jgi:hypothetical protein
MDFLGVSLTTGPGNQVDWFSRPTAMPLLTAGQQPIFVDDRAAYEAFSQTNIDFRRIVFLPREARGIISATGQTKAAVSDPKFDNQSISFQTASDGACMVVVSQSSYPSWKAYVDGEPVKLWRGNYAFQTLQVPAGTHRVRLLYRDGPFMVGLGLSGLGLAACIALWFATSKNRNHHAARAGSIRGQN